MLAQPEGRGGAGKGQGRAGLGETMEERAHVRLRSRASLGNMAEVV